MDVVIKIIMYLAGFLIISVASNQLARYFLKIKLPLITGLLMVGILAGPYLLGLISVDSVQNLTFVNEISLAFIAFAAGGELYLKELRGRLKSIGWNTFGQLAVIFSIGTFAVFFVSNYIPYIKEMSLASKIAIALLSGTIFVASSPSSVIAVITEMRARGPFTQIALGVTVIKDVLVIILFATVLSFSKTLVDGTEFNLISLGQLL